MPKPLNPVDAMQLQYRSGEFPCCSGSQGETPLFMLGNELECKIIVMVLVNVRCFGRHQGESVADLVDCHPAER